LEKNVDKIHRAGLGLAAVSYDSVPVLRNFAERQHITYPLLSDTDSKIIRAFGILNEETPKGTPFYGIPHPGIYIVDAKGVITGKYFEAKFTERDSAGLILLKQFGIEPEVEHVTQQAKHLMVTTAASSSVTRPGLKIALTVDVALEDKVHVYAPGVEGYIPISWTMAESPAVKAEAVKFPASRMLKLDAINETVPVFDGKFRLMREITIADEKTVRPLVDAAGNLTVAGSLKYQACDDRLCYLPVTVPVKWTVRVEALDRTRVPVELQRK
jgi:hypothetical protein